MTEPHMPQLFSHQSLCPPVLNQLLILQIQVAANSQEPGKYQKCVMAVVGVDGLFWRAKGEGEQKCK